MHIDLIELWHEMGLPVKAVVIVLTVQAIASLAVSVDRLIMLYRTSAASRAFVAKAAPLLQHGDVVTLYEEAKRADRSHLAELMRPALETYLDRILEGDDAERAAEFARRALERKGESLSEDLNRGLGVLASTGSTAPFVGLLGTVLGIIHAFQMIATTGSGGIGAIGAAIGEALIVTGYGLCVAIPTVLLYNWISGRIARLEMGLTNAGGELADRLRVLDAAAVASSGPMATSQARAKQGPDADAAEFVAATS